MRRQGQSYKLLSQFKKLLYFDVAIFTFFLMGLLDYLLGISEELVYNITICLYPLDSEILIKFHLNPTQINRMKYTLRKKNL